MKDNKATIIKVYNPFNLAKDREVEKIKADFTIKSWTDKNPNILTYPVVCIVNGEPILRTRWNDFVVKKDDIVVFFRLPQGGGGGGKNPLLAILGIALAVAGGIVFTGGLMIASIGLGATLTLVSTGILGAPEIPSTDQANQLSAPSPTYSLSSQGNNARIGESIPVVYGHNKVYPDFASQPYSEFIDNDQFLYSVLVIGQGFHDLHQIRIEDTPITDFKEITWEKIEPNGKITLFNDNVVTSLEVSGQELDGTNNIKDGDDGYIGAFIINPSETNASIIAIDVELPIGLYKANNNGDLDDYSLSFTVEAREVDKYGTEIGSWITLATETITDNTNTAIRKTFKYNLATHGRYEVRAKRTTEKSDDTKIGNVIRWSGAKAYLTDTVDYGHITLLAVKMKATDNLSSRSSRKINCLVTRKLPTWSPTGGWSDNVPTSSICWSLADILKASYGGKMDDSKIDLQGLYELDKVLTSRGDFLNGVFDRKMSLWEALKLACRVGRCAGILQGGVFRAIRDREQSIPVAMFTPRNIVKDSFSIKYSLASEDTVDGVTVEFINPNTWKPQEVSVDPFGNTPKNPAKVKLFGCTDLEQAKREGLYLSRNNIYRRKTISLTTELEGYIPTFGDLVVVSHDTPQWGQTGEVIGFNQNGSIMLSEPVKYDDNEKYYIAFRTKAGGVDGAYEIMQGSRSNDIILAGAWTYTHSPNGDYTIATNNDGDSIRLYYGTQEERTYYSLGIAKKWSQYGVVKAIRPRGDLQVELQILSEDNRVHAD